jgi:hypothetical protein
MPPPPPRPRAHHPKALYHKLSPGGYIIIDDMHLLGVQRALIDFRTKHNIQGMMKVYRIPT